MHDLIDPKDLDEQKPASGKSIEARNGPQSANEIVNKSATGTTDLPRARNSSKNKHHNNQKLIFTKLAFQNLLKRPTRTTLLLLAVAIGSGAVFSTVVVARGIQASIAMSFARMGADLVIVPEKTMVNITSALLTVQPTDETLAPQVLDKIASLEGVEQAAPQTIFRVPIMAGMPEHKANLIAFDPKRDFTVMPWVVDHMKRPLQENDLFSGGRRSESIGEEVQPCNSTATIYGKLGRSSVGPFDDSFFGTYETVKKIIANEKHLARNSQKITGDVENELTNETKPSAFSAAQGGISAILVKLKFGATPEQVRFAIANIPEVKVISGAKIVTATRETTTLLLNGIVVFIGFMLLGSLILVSLLFSAIISERKREIGLLRAIGARRSDLVGMLTAEAAFTMGLGGICGIVFGSVLLLLFQHALVYYLDNLHVEFAWPLWEEIGLTAFVCLAVAAAVGLLGAIIPAWRASAQDPYTLIQGEESSC